MSRSRTRFTHRSPRYGDGTQGGRVELWGLCPECERWFYCEEWHRLDAPTPVCPVCHSAAVTIEDRTPPLPARQLRAWSERLTLPNFDCARARYIEAGGAIA